MVTYKGTPTRLLTDFSAETLSSKVIIQIWRTNKTFTNKQKLREFIKTRLTVNVERSALTCITRQEWPLMNEWITEIKDVFYGQHKPSLSGVESISVIIILLEGE